VTFDEERLLWGWREISSYRWDGNNMIPTSAIFYDILGLITAFIHCHVNKCVAVYRIEVENR